MNELDYATLAASKRLEDAGIVLETDAIWDCSKVKQFADLRYRDKNIPEKDAIPAPSMAEVWRELPESKMWNGMVRHLGLEKFGDETAAYYRTGGPHFDRTNPTDALIDLLIWLKGEHHG